MNDASTDTPSSAIVLSLSSLVIVVGASGEVENQKTPAPTLDAERAIAVVLADVSKPSTL